MKVGERLPSETEIAKKLNLGLITVRRAMVDLAKEGFIVRHPGRGSFVGKEVYSKFSGDKGSRTIVMIMPGVEIPAHALVIQGAGEEAKGRELELAIRDCRLDPGTERKMLSELMDEEVAGLIIYPFFGDALDETYVGLIREIQSRGTKVVLVDQYIPNYRTPVVVHDNVQIGYMGTEHLIMLGHKRICFACTGANDVPGTDHLRGYRMALADYGIEFQPDLLITHPIAQCTEPTQRSVEVMLKENPRAFTAIAASQFSMTYGILKALSNLGLKCPEDIALVGANMYQNPELSYVTHTLQQDHRMGIEAMKVLVEEGGRGRKRHVLLEPELVIGTTCGGSR